MSQENWTVDRVLAWAIQDFQTRGIDSARLEAELLLSGVLALDRIQLILQRSRPLNGDELSRFRDHIKRRRRGEPLFYILGRREFFGHSFRVTAAVLIPRPDSEVLVETALARTQSRSMYGNLLDLCTGSGCIAVAFAKQRRTWRVLATDISEAALEVARHNVLRLGVVHQVELRAGDLFRAVPAGRRFDAIVANPPYIPGADVEALDVGIREFEPKLALSGGDDGLDVLRRIVRDAPSFLLPSGSLSLEIQFDQGEAVSALLRESGFEDVQVHRDLGQRDRVVSGTLGFPDEG
ncbi:MAG: peptide chain release factor N(5)-glutamine methyltransferase [Polyangiaceae bacterium]